MSSFSLTALALSHLSTMIMTLALIGFLWRLRKKPDTAWLIACLILIWFWLLGLFFDQTLSLISWRWIPIIVNIIYLVHIPLIQFAYSFPSPTPSLRREARWVLLLSGLSVPVVIWNVVAYLVSFFTDIHWLGLSRLMEWSLLAGTVWTVIVLWRRTVSFSAAAAWAAQEKRRGWLYCLVNPRGREARATRAFMLAGLVPLAGVIVAFTNPGNVSGYQNTFTGLLMIFITGVVYFNAVPQESTFMVKLVSITLGTLLAVLGLVGYTAAPFYEAAYRADHVVPRQTFHIRPNEQGGYAIAAVPFQFQDELGDKLDLDDDDVERVDLPFVFPFYDQTWTAIYASSNGRTAFDGPTSLYKLLDGSQPAIAPLSTDLDPTAGGGVFIRQGKESMSVTWQAVPHYKVQKRYTFQLVLYPDGSFDLNYLDIPAPISPQLNESIGFRPGDPSLPGEDLRSFHDLDRVSGVGGVILDGTSWGLRRHVHQRLLPLAYLIVGGSLFVLIVFPIFFHANLVKPLRNLLSGVKRVNAGNLEVTVPVGVEDEIGFLTGSFNDMVRSWRRSETSLRESEERFRALFEQAPLCILEVDCSSRVPVIVKANRQAEKTFGWSGRELITRSLDAMLPALFEQNAGAECDQIENTQTLWGSRAEVFESVARRRDGTTFPVRVSAASEAVTGAGECILIVQDITAEKERRSEEEAIAEERRRIAREIHDGLAQNLASMRLRVDIWHMLLDQDPAKLHAELDHLQALLAENIHDVRRSIFALRPVALEELGFYVALRQFIGGFGEQNQLDIDWQVAGPAERLPTQMEPVLFRIIQEALNNVAKHARASMVWIRLDLESAEVVSLHIRDDGTGFDPDILTRVVQEGHIGLTNMRERVEGLRGTFSLHSRRNQGTEIQVALPLRP